MDRMLAPIPDVLLPDASAPRPPASPPGSMSTHRQGTSSSRIPSRHQAGNPRSLGRGDRGVACERRTLGFPRDRKPGTCGRHQPDQGCEHRSRLSRWGTTAPIGAAAPAGGLAQWAKVQLLAELFLVLSTYLCALAPSMTVRRAKVIVTNDAIAGTTDARAPTTAHNGLSAGQMMTAVRSTTMAVSGAIAQRLVRKLEELRPET